jgi:transposase-like protein
VRQVEVARQLGVSAQAVSVWRARFIQGGTEALRSRGPSGPAPRLSDAQLDRVEGPWSSLKAVELANLTSPTLAEVIDQTHRGIDRVRRTPYLPYSFLRHTGLSVS